MRSSPIASPDAYERLVDRLLASPHYGERWGRHWLDLARYADSNGYTRDFGRQIWKYRDWVIDAINRDLPFDQFTIEQIAGDMLPEATRGATRRDRLSPQHADQRRRRHRPGAVPRRGGGRSREHDRLGVAGPDGRLRPLPLRTSTTRSRRSSSTSSSPCSTTATSRRSKCRRGCSVERGELARREQIRGEIKAAGRGAREAAAGAGSRAAGVGSDGHAAAAGPAAGAGAGGVRHEVRQARREEQEDDRGLLPADGRWPGRRFRSCSRSSSCAKREPKIPTTMILRERTEPRETFVHKRGDFLDRGAGCDRRRAGGAAAAAAGSSEQAQSARFRPLARVGRESADAARVDEPRLAKVLWPRPGRDGRRFRHARDAADASGTARLAGDRVRRPRLGRRKRCTG